MKTSVIEPEHILLGLLKDQNEVTADVFQELGIEYTAVKKRITVNTQVNEKLFDSDDMDLSSDTRKLLEHAVTEARRMRHQYIDCEHLLLGISLLPRTRVTRLRKQAGIPTAQIYTVTRQMINRWRAAQGLAPHPIPTTAWHSSFTDYARRRGFVYYEALESSTRHYALQHELTCTPLSDALIDHLLAAVDETRQMKLRRVEPEQILLSLARDAASMRDATGIWYNLGYREAEINTLYDRLKAQQAQRAEEEQSVTSNKVQRLTSRARYALSRAQEAALTSKQSAVEPGHLMLGLTLEEGSIAQRVLQQLGVDYPAVKEAVKNAMAGTVDNTVTDTISQRAAASVQDTAAPDQDTPPDLSETVKQLLNLAVDEARKRDHSYIDTEHLLLGLSRVESDQVTELFRQLKISPAQIQTTTDRILHEPPPQVTHAAAKMPRARNRWFSFAGISSRFRNFSLQRELDQTPLSAEALKGLMSAIETARQTGKPRVEVEHLLLSLLETQSEIWDNLGYNKEEIEALRDKVRQRVTTSDRRENASL